MNSNNLFVPPKNDPGVIAGNQTNCGAFAAAKIISISEADFSPEKGVAYKWYKTNLNIPFVEGSTQWSLISGATLASYDPGLLSSTTYFVRFAYLSQGGKSTGASNIITIKIIPNV